MSIPSELPDQSNIHGYYHPNDYVANASTWNDRSSAGNHITWGFSHAPSNTNKPTYGTQGGKYAMLSITSSPRVVGFFPRNMLYNNNINDNWTMFFVTRRGKPTLYTDSHNGTNYDGDGRCFHDGSRNTLWGQWGWTEGVTHYDGLG